MNSNTDYQDLSDGLPPLGKRLTFRSRVKRFAVRNRALFLSMAVPMAIMALLYTALNIARGGDGTVLVLDLNGQYVAFYEALRNFIRTGNTSLLYSFSRALGGEFMGIYGYYIASPFSWLVGLFPDGCIQEALLCIFVLKVGISGGTFCFYLQKTQSRRSSAAMAAFSTLYALSSYAIVYQHNSMWMDALMWLPILSYGIEKLIRFGDFRTFVAFFALTLMSNYYIGYMCCYYVVAYYFTYYFAKSGNGENNPRGEKFHFMKSSLRIFLWSCVAIGIACVMLLTAYYSLKFGKTEFTQSNWTFTLRSDLVKLFAMFLPGNYDTVRPAGLPILFCGTATLLLVPAFFVSRKIGIREKIGYGAIVSFFLVSFTFNVVDLVWHGFQKPNWLNYRYSFMLTFILLVMAYRAFADIKQLKPGVLVAAGAAWAGLTFYLQTVDHLYLQSNVSSITSSMTAEEKSAFNASAYFDLRTVIFPLVMIAVFLAALGAAAVTKKAKRRGVAWILLGCVIVEVTVNGLLCMEGLGYDVGYSSHNRYSSYAERMEPTMAQIREADSSFYRSETTIMRSNVSKDDNQLLMMRGLTESTSTLNAANIAFMARMGYAARSHWIVYMEGTPVNDSLFGIKYLITQYDRSALYGEEWATREITSSLTYHIYENPNALSIAFAGDDAIRDVDLDDYFNPMDRLNAVYTALLGEEETQELFVPVEPTRTKSSGFSTHTKDTGDVEYSGSSGVLTYEYVAPTDGAYYFFLSESMEYLTTTYQTEFTVNGEDSYEFNGTYSGKTVYLGTFAEGDPIKIEITPTNSKFYVMPDCANLYYVDTDLLASSCATLNEGSLVIDENYTEDHLSGSLRAKEDMTVFTTIPYDEGWRVYVDGERVKTEEVLGNLVAFAVAAGEHRIDLIYCPDVFVIGCICTVSMIVLFLFSIAFRKTWANVPVFGALFAAKSPKKKEAGAEEVPPVPNDNNPSDKEGE